MPNHVAGSAAGNETRPKKGQCMQSSLPEQILRGLKGERLQGREAMEAGLSVAQVICAHAHNVIAFVLICTILFNIDSIYWTQE